MFVLLPSRCERRPRKVQYVGVRICLPGKKEESGVGAARRAGTAWEGRYCSTLAFPWLAHWTAGTNGVPRYHRMHAAGAAAAGGGLHTNSSMCGRPGKTNRANLNCAPCSVDTRLGRTVGYLQRCAKRKRALSAYSHHKLDPSVGLGMGCPASWPPSPCSTLLWTVPYRARRQVHPNRTEQNKMSSPLHPIPPANHAVIWGSFGQ